MATRICKDCGIDISDRGNRAIRCKQCQAEYRKTSNRYGNLPPSARGKYWQYWKHLLGMTDTELTFLYGMKRRECGHIRKSHPFREIRTEMKLICRAYGKGDLENGI